VSSSVLIKLIEENEWVDIPSQIITREGHAIDTSNNQWHLPYSMKAHATLDFNNIINPSLRWVTKRYIQEKIQITSTHAGYSNFQDIKREFLRFQNDYGLRENLNNKEIENKLISIIEHRISLAREKHRLWALYRPIQWYIWCAENHPELGFCSAYAMELDSMVLPGNPKGEAVRMEDPDSGPLHRSLELPLVIKALREDKSHLHEHLQQKVAVALSIALGRNPANLTYLKETDFINLTAGSEDACYILKMPRIKKRQLNPRDDFMEEYLDPEFAEYVQELITANKRVNTVIDTKHGSIQIDKPLFIKVDKNKAALSAGLINESFNLPSAEISDLLKRFVKRHNIISPLTGEILHLSTRRLRYTLATSLASEGVSKRELARILDHTEAKKLEIEGLEQEDWNNNIWTVKSRRLSKQSGKNVLSATLIFNFPPKISRNPLPNDWSDLIKTLVLLRLHRNNQSIANQRMFIAAVGCIAHEAFKISPYISQLTPEILDSACRLIASHYSEGAAYNMHKAIGEFVAHCDANGLCNVFLNYRFTGMKRPDSASGLGYKRLDDPNILETTDDKIILPEVFRVIGELYQNLPRNHKYRFYILVLALLACLGRRFSEIALLPQQNIKTDNEDRAFIEYFPRKQSRGDTFTPLRKLYLPTATIPIITEILFELEQCCLPARTTATEMRRANGPDLNFLAQIPNDKPLYREDLVKLGLSPSLLSTVGWLRTKGYTYPDHNKLTRQNKKPNHPMLYTTKDGITKYCQKDFSSNYNQPIHTDQTGKKYYLENLLLVRHRGLAAGAYSCWIATQCTHSMITTFFRYLDGLVSKYASSLITSSFTCHHFRHTLNTLLDEGGLSDLLQTEWFGRKNPQDTKAYQHTSREKRALMLREDIKQGRVGGQIADKLKSIPVTVQDAFLKARINAVHDVGSGICVHNFVQTPCERHLQCSADCKDYVWVKNDEGRTDDLKRQYSMTVIARETAEKKSKEKNSKKSIDWFIHNDKKLNTLSKQLADNNILEFDPYQYIGELIDE
jgi:integrase